MDNQSPDKKAKRVFYIQGYKIDPHKIRITFPKEEHENDEGYEDTWYPYIIGFMPETAYQFLGTGVEPDGDTCFVFVLNYGYDEAKMKEYVIKPPDTLPDQALQLLTPGIWPCGEDGNEDHFGPSVLEQPFVFTNEEQPLGSITCSQCGQRLQGTQGKLKSSKALHVLNQVGPQELKEC